MTILYSLKEMYTNGYISNILDIISLFSIFFAVFILGSKNPIHSLLFLIGLFGSISIYLLILGFSFIGLAYLIVYIGAVSILFLFILMLINIRISELQSNTNNSIFLAIFIIIWLEFFLFKILPYNITNKDFTNYYLKFNLPYTTDHFFYLYFANSSFKNIAFVTNQIWDGYLIQYNAITSIGTIMYTYYSTWFLLTGIILLLSLAGTIIITGGK